MLGCVGPWCYMDSEQVSHDLGGKAATSMTRGVWSLWEDWWRELREKAPRKNPVPSRVTWTPGAVWFAVAPLCVWTLRVPSRDCACSTNVM